MIFRFDAAMHWPKPNELWQKFLGYPLSGFFLLQLAVIFYLRFPGLIAFCVLGALLWTIQRHHQKSGTTRTFLVFVFILAASSIWHLSQLAPLSENILPKKAQYAAFTLNDPEFADHITHIPIELRERISPQKDSVHGHVLLSIVGDCKIAKHSLIKLKTRVKEASSYQNPGVFDYADYLKRQNIWGKAFIENCSDIEIITSGQPTARDQLRTQLLNPLDSSKNAAVLKALLLGTRTLDRELKTNLRKAGLSHLMAISGMNFAVMSAMIFAFISLITSIFPKIYFIWPRQKIAAIFTLLFVIFFAFVADHQASLLRSALMMAVYLCAMLFERQKNLPHVILLSALLMLLWSPFDLFDVSFQLSYLCVLILAFVVTRLQEWAAAKGWPGSSPKALVFIVELATITALMQILLLPAMLFQFGTFPPMGFINNLWAIPYFDFVIVPLSLVYFFAALIGTALSTPVLLVWDHTTGWFLAMANKMVGPTLTALPTPHLQHVLLFYALIFLFFGLRHSAIKQKLTRVFSAVFVLSITITTLQSWGWGHTRIQMIDVGQGDSFLIKTPAKTVLIDAGGHPFFDLGTQVLAPFLRYEWISHIDIVMITHPDRDHYDGLLSLLDEIPIGEVWINNQVVRESGYRALIDKISSLKIPVRVIRDEFWENLDEHNALHVLSPTPDLSLLEEDNDHSIVLQLRHCNHSSSDSCHTNPDTTALFTGDLTRIGEAALVQKYGTDLKSDILKIGHHGSKSSSSATFLDHVAPQIALIGVGANNAFRHPSNDVLDRLKERHISIKRSDRDGEVSIDLDRTIE